MLSSLLPEWQLQFAQTLTVSYTHLDVYKRQEKGQFVSKSTMRRRKLRVVEKARKVIFMVTSLDRGCLEP